MGSSKNQILLLVALLISCRESKRFVRKFEAEGHYTETKRKTRSKRQLWSHRSNRLLSSKSSKRNCRSSSSTSSSDDSVILWHGMFYPPSVSTPTFPTAPTSSSMPSQSQPEARTPHWHQMSLPMLPISEHRRSC